MRVCVSSFSVILISLFNESVINICLSISLFNSSCDFFNLLISTCKLSISFFSLSYVLTNVGVTLHLSKNIVNNKSIPPMIRWDNFI